MTRLTFVLAAMLSFMACTPVAAQDLMKGMGAYDAKDYVTALQELRRKVFFVQSLCKQRGQYKQEELF